MELDVLQVNHPRSGAVGHRQAVAARSRGVSGVEENLPQTASRQDHLARQDALHPARRLVEDIRPVAAQSPVDTQRIARVVREGD